MMVLDRQCLLVEVSACEGNATVTCLVRLGPEKEEEGREKQKAEARAALSRCLHTIPRKIKTITVY